MCSRCWAILRSVLGLKPIWMTQFASSWDLFWLPWDGGSFCYWLLGFHSELYRCHLWLSQTFLLCVFANMVKRTGHRGRAIDVREEPFIPKKRAPPFPPPPRLLYCPKYCKCQQRTCSCELVSALALLLELKKRWSVRGFGKPFWDELVPPPISEARGSSFPCRGFLQRIGEHPCAHTQLKPFKLLKLRIFLLLFSLTAPDSAVPPSFFSEHSYIS